MIDSVISLVGIPIVKVGGDSLAEVAKNYKTLQDEDMGREEARKELLESHLCSDISRDGQTAALQLFLKRDSEYSRFSDERNRLILKRYTEGLSDEEQWLFEETTEFYMAKLRKLWKYKRMS